MAKKFKQAQFKEKKKKEDKKVSDFQSQGEARFFEGCVLPKLLTKEILQCDVHRTFEIIPSVNYSGEHLRARVYTPDFFLVYSDGSCVVVEIKDSKVRQLQRDYPLRKQLFLLNYCIPNNWIFQEIESKGEYSNEKES